MIRSLPRAVLSGFNM